MKVGEEMNTQEWMKDALFKIQSIVRYGDTFTLKGLFEENKWKVLKKGEASRLGRHFSEEVQECRVPEVILCGKAKNGHNLYKRVRHETEE